MNNSEFCLWKLFVSRMGKDKISPAIGVLLLAGAMAVRAEVASTNAAPGEMAATNAELSALSNMSIEQLMDIKVSILGPSETVSRTPAAVSVVTQDDIKRSGARNIPEALRLVPGLDVAQIDSSEWAVSARGFNDQSANKLLVLEDGRSIYTPLFSGVFWDVQDTMMENIDHIEVVRGPGATVWGANAVNGVINIITKSAEDTQGWLVSGAAARSNAVLRMFVTAGKSATTPTTEFMELIPTMPAPFYRTEPTPPIPGRWPAAVFGWTGMPPNRIRSPFRATVTWDGSARFSKVYTIRFRHRTPNQFRMTGKCMAPMCWATGRTRFPTRPI